MVLAGVVADIKHLKIFNPVVRPTAVDVVYVLRGEQGPAKMSLHNAAMLKNVDASSGELNVPVLSDKTPDNTPGDTAASHRTEAHRPAPDSTRLDRKHRSTNFAGAIDHKNASSSVVTKSIVVFMGTASNGF